MGRTDPPQVRPRDIRRIVVVVTPAHVIARTRPLGLQALQRELQNSREFSRAGDSRVIGKRQVLTVVGYKV
jgi:hypothetical protein